MEIMQITINGESIDISHLCPITRTMTLDLRGGTQKKDARLEFRFSCHCYSRGPRGEEAIPEDMRVLDGSTQQPRDRIFCPNRYKLSFQLVEKIDALIASNGNVEKSRHLNFFATSLVVQDEGGNTQDVPYYVFMKAKKKQDPNQPAKLDIFVESAYPGDPNIPAPVAKGNPTRLSAVLGEVWANSWR